MSCNDYLVLNPEKASLFDLTRLLVSEDLVKGKDFLEKPQGLAAADEYLKKLRYRWIVFISIVFQKIFLLLRNPIVAFGYSLRIWLDLVFVNGGLFQFIVNCIRGNVVRPSESSWEEGRSVVGYIDIRNDLDKNMKLEDDDERFVVHLSLMASKLSYENSSYVEHVVTNNWQMKFLHFYDFWNEYLGEFATQAFVFQTSTKDPDLLIISFRGTEPFDLIDWCTDVDISWYGIEGVGKLHGGFMKALGLQNNMGWPNESNNNIHGPIAYHALRQILREKARENKNTRFILTGHSLGGALAILFAGMLIVHDESEILRRFRGVYTFGQPRVGDAEFGQFMLRGLKIHKVKYRRFVYSNDVVPRLPYDDKTFFFKHFGKCFFYDCLYKGKILTEEPNRNYFSPFWVIPKYLTAFWELIRGQTVLPLVKGRLYGEWFGLVMFRIIGLIIPGLSAHGLQDYDNITRLGNTRLLPETASGSVLQIEDTLKVD
ncbi:hypothetical protein V2J09_007160 [Rumex salicifolius]